MRAFSVLATLALIPLSLAMGRSHGTAANLLSRSEDTDTLVGSLTNDTLFANKMQTQGGKWHRPGQKCSGNPLRDPKDHCHCKPGLKDIDGSCCCGDSANTLLTLQGCKFGGGGCDQPVCVCEDKWAQYDNDKKMCFCPPGTVAVYEPDGKLKCKRQEPSPRSNARRGIVDAIAEHREDSMESVVSLESVMQCRVGEKACKVGPAFVCTDVSSDLAACGACPGEAEDCASLSGVDEVRCDRGRCVIDSCQRGFTLTPAPTRADPTSNLPAFICKAKTASSSSSWLNFQRHAGEV